MTETIYIALLDEGVNARRPAKAYRRSDGAFIVLRPKDYDPESETWEFPPGSAVICEKVKTATGEVLAAVRAAEEDERLTDRRAV